MNIYANEVSRRNYHSNRKAASCQQNFSQCVPQAGCPKSLIFHNDHGIQYTAKAFMDLLKKKGIKQSFSSPGNPLDNAVAESFFATFKKENAYRQDYTSERSFIEDVANYIDFFNNVRV